MGEVDRGTDTKESAGAAASRPALAWTDDALDAERVVVHEELLAAVEGALAARDAALERVAVAERVVVDARAALDRVLEQRAQADETIGIALRRAEALEAATEPESDLRRRAEEVRGELTRTMALVPGAGPRPADTARARELLAAARTRLDAEAREARAELAHESLVDALEAALAGYLAARGATRDPDALALAAEWDDLVGNDPARLVPVSDDDVVRAQAAVHDARRRAQAVEDALRARPEHEWAIDAAADQLQLWAAQRAVEQAEHDLVGLRTRRDREPDVLALRCRVESVLGYEPLGDVGDVLRRHRPVPPPPRDALLAALRAAGAPLDGSLHECAERWLGAVRRTVADRWQQLATTEAGIAELDVLAADLERAHAELLRLETALAVRAELDESTDPAVLAGALRTQASSVASSVAAAHEERCRALAAAEAALEDARREAAAATSEVKRVAEATEREGVLREATGLAPDVGAALARPRSGPSGPDSTRPEDAT